MPTPRNPFLIQTGVMAPRRQEVSSATGRYVHQMGSCSRVRLPDSTCKTGKICWRAMGSIAGLMTGGRADRLYKMEKKCQTIFL